MKISDTFQKAKEVLLTQGWTQSGGFSTGPIESKESVCLYGAIAVAQGFSDFNRVYGSPTADFLTRFAYYTHKIHSIPLFNDDPSTTEQDVLELLDEATINAKELGL